jgi:hypothetical protein
MSGLRTGRAIGASFIYEIRLVDGSGLRLDSTPDEFVIEVWDGLDLTDRYTVDFDRHSPVSIGAALEEAGRIWQTIALDHQHVQEVAA